MCRRQTCCIPPWLWNPWVGSHEVQNRANSGPTKWTLVQQKFFFKNHFTLQGSSSSLQLGWIVILEDFLATILGIAAVLSGTHVWLHVQFARKLSLDRECSCQLWIALVAINKLRCNFSPHHKVRKSIFLSSLIGRVLTCEKMFTCYLTVCWQVLLQVQLQIFCDVIPYCKRKSLGGGILRIASG